MICRVLKVELTQEPEAILPDLNPPSDPTSEANELRFCACDKRRSTGGGQARILCRGLESLIFN